MATMESLTTQLQREVAGLTRTLVEAQRSGDYMAEQRAYQSLSQAMSYLALAGKSPHPNNYVQSNYVPTYPGGLSQVMSAMPPGVSRVQSPRSEPIQDFIPYINPEITRIEALARLERDAAILGEVLEERYRELRRKISQTESPIKKRRYRNKWFKLLNKIFGGSE